LNSVLTAACPLESLALQSTPTPAEGVEAHRRVEAGRQVVILKHRARATYCRLSGLSAFVWNHLDGRRSVSEIGACVAHAGGPLSPTAILRALGALAHGGYVQGFHDPGAAPMIRSGRWARASRACLRAATLRWVWSGADSAFGGLYARGARWLLHPLALAVFGPSILIGLGRFALLVQDGWFARAQALSVGPAQVLGLMLASWLATIAHESAHALTIKHFKREVLRAGVGWFWFGPCAFVDASDMWLGTRSQRIAVSLAGPFCDGLTGSLATGLCVVLPAAWAPFAFVFAFDRFLAILYCLSPLTQGDGYCILVDATGRSNLRSQALGWMVRELPRGGWRPTRLRARAIEAVYAAGAVGYAIALTTFTLCLWHRWIAAWLEHAGPAGVASVVGWGLTALLGGPIVLGFFVDLARCAARRTP
jgi:putative peptide zinc metalloprotease protein